MFLLESIRIEEGKIQLINYHQKRMQAAAKQLWQAQAVDVTSALKNIPPKGIYKCRIVYSKQGIERLDFIPYQKKEIRSLRLLADNNIHYQYKYADRIAIETLYAQAKPCDDIIITQDGYLSDSSYCNIALQTNEGKWHTPNTPLLAGVMRSYLLDKKIIHAQTITTKDLSRYHKLRLFNAMMPWDDCIELSTTCIQF